MLSVTAISGDGGDVILLAVQREVNGQQRVFLERLAEPLAPSTPIEDAYFVDCGVTFRSEAETLTVTGLDHLEGCALAVLADGSPVEGCVVDGGSITLPYAAKVVQAGLPYTSVLSPLPVEADTQQGSTLGKRRAYGRCVVRCFAAWAVSTVPAATSLTTSPFCPLTMANPANPIPAT